MNNPSFEDRNLRQREIIPPERLKQCRATVIGVGAIGRQVALQLAALGIPRMQLIDHDTVEAVNLGPQGYFEEDMGRPKVQATADLCHRLNSGLDLQTIQGRFKRNMEVGNVLFCCVDSIETRRLIWEAVCNRVRFFCDGRMSAEVLRVLTACDENSRGHYPTTLFPAAEAHRGACTARSTIFCANVAAGLMVGQFSKFLRGLPVEGEVQVNLLGMEISIANPVNSSCSDGA